VDEGRVLDHEGIGLHDQLARAHLSIVDAIERDDRRAGPFGSEAREWLRVPTLAEGGDREQLRRGHDPGLPRPWKRTWNTLAID
jgi:hypothetical protein